VTAGATCLVADDHPGVVAALSAFLAEHGYDVVVAADGAAAVARAEAVQPRFALVDYRMPRLAGAELVREVKRAAPAARLAVYTGDADAGLVADALAGGADGVVLKEAPLPDLLRALEALDDGRLYLDPALPVVPSVMPAAPASLTAREAEVLALLAEGLSHEQIGSRLAIGAETVRTHVRKASTRLGAGTRTQAVARALRLGLIA
jgi:DNA-binding NarL/FixJ family response regulator